MATPASAQLVSAITANQTTVQLQNIVTPTGSVGFPPLGVYLNYQQPLIIDQEVMYIVTQISSSVYQVRSRGAEGTLANPHDANANVYTGTASDFAGVDAVAQFDFFDIANSFPISIGSATYTVTLPYQNTTYNLNTPGSPAAITLPTPIGGMNGIQLTFTNNTAIAHVITCTNGFQSGVGAQPKSTATMAAVVGSTGIFVAENGFWNVLPSSTVTVA